MKVIDADTELYPWYSEKMIDDILERISKYEAEGSGWKLSSITELQISICRYIGYRGSSFIDLPPSIRNKKAVINVQNRDNMCFKWAIYSMFRYESGLRNNCNRVLSYADANFLINNPLNFSKVLFPMDVTKIKYFEIDNINVSVNVYTLKSKKNSAGLVEEIVVPLRLTKAVKINHVNLLLLQSSTAADIVNTHYCWISNFSGLISSQVSKHNGKIYICNRCLHYFQRSSQLDKHMENCMNQNECALILPKENEKMLKFVNFKNQIRVPFRIYADIEAILKPLDDDDDNTVFSRGSNTRAYQKHIACSVGYYLKSDVSSVESRYAKDRSPNCVKWFVQELYKIYQEVENVFQTNMPMNLNEDEQAHFDSAMTCHICGLPFIDTDIKVRDHDHLRGNYRGPSHQICNLRYQDSRTIPVIFHNLSNYDAHFIIKDIASEEIFEGDVSLTPLNTEKYISFTKTVKDSVKKHASQNTFRNVIRYKFLDSYRFLASSLDLLASYLPSSDKTILYEAEWPGQPTLEDLKLLERKGVMAYDYVSSWDKFDETTLPAYEDFYSTLI